MVKVCMAQYLAIKYPEVYWPIRINLEAHGIKVVSVNNTRNIWVRDYFPIQIGTEYVRFQYAKDARYAQLDISNEPWTGIVAPIRESTLIVDGGNIVQGFGKVILTDMVIRKNGKKAVKKLEKIFEAEVIIIPTEPGDTLGHSDGICKFVDKDTVLVNDYSEIRKKDSSYKGYQSSLEMALAVHGLNVELFPNAYAEWDWEMSEKQFREIFPEADDYNPGFGYYINFLKINNLILLPAMKIKKDREALKAVNTFYRGSNVVMVDCSRLSMEGGLVGCVTVDYAAH